MTDEQIDALIAYKLLGWRYNRSSFEQYEPSTWVDIDGKRVWGPDFRPTIDILAAWRVVDELGGSHKFTLMSEHGSWFCSFDGGPEVTDQETPELAICLAALKARGIID